MHNVNQALAYLASAGISLTAEDIEIAMARKKHKTAEQDCGLLELIAGTLAYFKVRHADVPCVPAASGQAGLCTHLRGARVVC